MPGAQAALSPHDAAMVAKVDSTNAALQPPADPAAPAPVQRPEHIPEKFWDSEKGTAKVDELAKSYAELERSRSQALAKPPEQAPAGTNVAPDEFVAFSTEYATNGKLSDESYAALAAKGLPKAVVDDYIASKAAAARVAEFEAKEATAEAHSLAGSADAYNSMLDWAQANLSPADQAAFDAAVVGDAASRKQAITSLKAQYTAARGSDPKLLAGEGEGGGSGAFQSRAEVTTAMRDPRYKEDPAYRATVERRLAAMPVF